MFSHLCSALVFLLCVPSFRKESAKPLSAEALWACVPIGTLIGIATALIGAAALTIGAPERLTAWLIIATSTLLTGALHEDGLADAIDGLLGGQNPQDRLRIMKAPNIGTYAVLGLIIAKTIEAELLAVILRESAMSGLVFIAALHGISRGFWGLCLHFLPAVESGKASLAHKLGDPPSATSLSLSLAAAALIAIIATPLISAVAICLTLWIMSYLWSIFCYHKIGGINGDCLGALQQINFLIGLAIFTLFM